MEGVRLSKWFTIVFLYEGHEFSLFEGLQMQIIADEDLQDGEYFFGQDWLLPSVSS